MENKTKNDVNATESIGVTEMQKNKYTDDNPVEWEEEMDEVDSLEFFEHFSQEEGNEVQKMTEEEWKEGAFHWRMKGYFCDGKAKIECFPESNHYGHWVEMDDTWRDVTSDCMHRYTQEEVEKILAEKINKEWEQKKW